MIEFPEAELEQARAFYRSWLLRRVRIDFQSRWQIRLVRMLAPLAHLAPSPLRKLGLAAETARVAANGRSVPVRIVRPKGPARGIVVDIHGGGWTILRAVQDDPLNGALAQAGFAVVSVDYRWAPEHPFQAVIDDAETALAWALAEGQRELGASDVLLHGDSAGAHLSLAAALRCRPSSPDFARLRGLVLWYGVFDLTATPSVRAAPPESLVPVRPDPSSLLRARHRRRKRACTPRPRHLPALRRPHRPPARAGDRRHRRPPARRQPPAGRRPARGARRHRAARRARRPALLQPLPDRPRRPRERSRARVDGGAPPAVVCLEPHGVTAAGVSRGRMSRTFRPQSRRVLGALPCAAGRSG
jgi:acetyl esterase/lipase